MQDGLVLRQCDHSKPVTQVLQERAVREVGSSFVRCQKYLEGRSAISDLKVVLKASNKEQRRIANLDIPVGLGQNHFVEVKMFQSIHEVGV